MRHSDVHRAFHTDSRFYERLHRHSGTPFKVGLSNSFLPRSQPRFNGFPCFCQQDRLPKILWQTGLCAGQTFRRRYRLRWKLGHLGRTFPAILLRKDGRNEATVYDGFVYSLKSSPLCRARQIQRPIQRRAAAYPQVHSLHRYGYRPFL